MGLQEMVKLSLFLLLSVQINHLGINQFLIQRQHCEKILFERANTSVGRWWSFSPKFVGEAMTVTLMVRKS